MAEHTGQSSQLFPVATGRNAQFLATVARSAVVKQVSSPVSTALLRVKHFAQLLSDCLRQMFGGEALLMDHFGARRMDAKILVQTSHKHSIQVNCGNYRRHPHHASQLIL